MPLGENDKQAFNTERGQELAARLLDQPNPALGHVYEAVSDGTPDTEFSISHGLGRVPSGCLVIGQDKAASVYNGSTANDDATLYLRCDTATVALKVLVW